MSSNHLERRGYKPNLPKLKSKGTHRIDGAIVAHRARKFHPCAAEDCDLPDIEWDEVYVSVMEPSTFQGRHLVTPPQRYHMSCAFRHELIVKDESKTERIDRRGAIAMTKARIG